MISSDRDPSAGIDIQMLVVKSKLFQKLSRGSEFIGGEKLLFLISNMKLLLELGNMFVVAERTGIGQPLRRDVASLNYPVFKGPATL